MPPLFRVRDSSGGEAFAAGDALEPTLFELLPGGLLEAFGGRPSRRLALDEAVLLAPVDRQEVWAAGVTYRRSRDARVEESHAAAELYTLVYEAERPELFFKATPERVRGPGDDVCVRSDSEWNVPEPELALLYGPDGAVVAASIGNDVSSRSIEGANPLYLPQAKVYDGSCALGPAWVPVAELPPLDGLRIELTVVRDGVTLFEGATSTAELRRSPEALGSWLGRATSFPDGVVLLTGTSLVPPADVSLTAGDEIAIAIDGLGTLRNRVAVARGWAASQ